MTRLHAPNDEAARRIGRAADQMLESMTYYCEERDTLLHLEDIHDQFKAIAKLLGYTVTREKLS